MMANQLRLKPGGTETMFTGWRKATKRNRDDTSSLDWGGMATVCPWDSQLLLVITGSPDASGCPSSHDFYHFCLAWWLQSFFYQMWTSTKLSEPCHLEPGLLQFDVHWAAPQDLSEIDIHAKCRFPLSCEAHYIDTLRFELAANHFSG